MNKLLEKIIRNKKNNQLSINLPRKKLSLDLKKKEVRTPKYVEIEVKKFIYEN